MVSHFLAVVPDRYIYISTNMGIHTTYRLCILCISRAQNDDTQGSEAREIYRLGPAEDHKDVLIVVRVVQYGIGRVV